MLGPLEALIRLHELSTSDKAPTTRTANEIERCKSELPPEMVDRHEYLIGRYGSSAVVPIKSGCCSGCYISMPSSRRNKLEEGLFACEHCGRLLYDESKVYDIIGLQSRRG